MKKFLFISLLILLCANVNAQNITAFEYFVDNDPGVGAATTSNASPSPTVSDFNIPISLSPLSLGFHKVGVRAKNSLGEWTQTHTSIFYIVGLDVTIKNITQIEYFIDTDPGVGAATQVTGITPSTSINNLAIDVSLASLTPGFHQVSIRSKNSAGEWTHTRTQGFYIAKLPSTPNIVKFEYFFDTDQGYEGDGTTSVAVTPPSPAVTGQDVIVEIPTSLSLGTHTLYLRAKDNQGNWTTVVTKSINISGPFTSSGLRLWLRASDLTLPDNSLVSTWPDASGLGNDFTSTGAFRPTFRTNGCPNVINSQPFISFDPAKALYLGRNDVLGMAANTARTFIAVYKLNNPAQRAFVVEQGDYSTPGIYFGADANTWMTAGNKFGVYATANSYDSDIATDTLYHIQFVTAKTMAVGTNIINDIEYRVDDNLATLTGRDLQSGGNYQSFAGANGMRINGNTNIAEVIAYDRVLTTSERDEIVAYLRGKYSFTEVPPPAITSFSPTSADAGTSVVINGTGFNPVASGNVVQFNGADAVVTASTTSSITVTVPAGATDGLITVITGCRTVKSDVDFIRCYAPTAPTGNSANACNPGSVTLTASGATGSEEYRWYDSVVNGTLLSSTGSYKTPELTGTTSYYVSITNGACESPRTVVTVVVQDCGVNHPPVIQPLSVEVLVGQSKSVSLISLLSDPDDDLDLSTLRVVKQPASGADASINDQYELVLDYSKVSFSESEEITIEVCDLSGACTQLDIIVKIIVDIVVYNAVSPNNDGLNDILFLEYIDVIEATKSNRVSIYNRWGDLLFEVGDYNNKTNVFRGINKNGNEIPSGTYFYKIEFFGTGTNQRKSQTGFLSIKR